MNEQELPKTCCMNVAKDNSFQACDKPAVYWYKHNEDICSFCIDHNYQCGEPIYEK